jgi:hypothetical protein
MNRKKGLPDKPTQKGQISGDLFTRTKKSVIFLCGQNRKVAVFEEPQHETQEGGQDTRQTGGKVTEFVNIEQRY